MVQKKKSRQLQHKKKEKTQNCARHQHRSSMGQAGAHSLLTVVSALMRMSMENSSAVPMLTLRRQHAGQNNQQDCREKPRPLPLCGDCQCKGTPRQQSDGTPLQLACICCDRCATSAASAAAQGHDVGASPRCR